jgi:hypothetical protein
MKSRPALPLSHQIPSDPAIWLYSTLTGAIVFPAAVLVLWLIYNDFLNYEGPLRIVGSLIAAVLASLFTAGRMREARRRKLEILHRFETIRWMTDRIRNSLQAIECITYANNPEATASVSGAVGTIDAVLNEVLAGSHPSVPPRVTEMDGEPISKSVPS